MANLLAENFRRLFKGKRFYVVLFVIIGLSCLFTGLLYLVNTFIADEIAEEVAMSGMGSLKTNADKLLLYMKSDMPLLIGITAGMLIVQDFRNNTIRNKVTVGHSRVKIYLSNFIVSETVMLIYEGAYFIVSAVLGGIVLGFDKFPSKDTVIIMLMTLLIQMALTSLIVFFCNTMKNVGGFVLAITMTYIAGIFQLALNLLNKMPKVQELIVELVPSYQLIELLNSATVPDHAVRMALFMVGITVLSTAGGILLFRKSELK